MKHITALITGASSGIGEALCRRLAKEGLKLIITGRNQEKLNGLSQELGCVIQTIQADLLLADGREKVVAALRQFSPDLVINNAGFGLSGEALSHSTDKQISLLEVNCKAVLEFTLESARLLREKQMKGVILNVSSAAAFMIFPYSAVYAATKAFVTSFSQSFDMEMEPAGIRILSSNPGMVATEFVKRAGGEEEGYPHHPFVMNAQEVADEIWNQICALNPLQIVDWKYRILASLGSLIPQRWIGRLLQSRIKKRINHKG